MRVNQTLVRVLKHKCMHALFNFFILLTKIKINVIADNYMRITYNLYRI